MQFSSKIHRILLFTLFLLCIPALRARPVKVMILTGHTDKYHNWPITSQYLKAILDNEKVFQTDSVTLPALGPAFDAFVPDFDSYDVVVLKLNLPDWNEKAKSSLEKYVKNGGGMVVLHEAGNAFIHWPEYNEMIGLGGWGYSNAFPAWMEHYHLSDKEGWPKRSEKNGPYVYWKEGAIVKDYSPGSGGDHGSRVPYVVNIRNTEHPITKGLPLHWLQVEDELYGNLRGPANNLTVLATAFSDKKSGGTGKEEPVLMTIDYGKGRVFHSVMGHTAHDFFTSMFNVGFQVTFSRGTEWAATGNVTQAVPIEFPTDTTALFQNLFPLP